MDGRDLVIIALSGVQQFITESRTTADLYSGSEIIATLAREAARLVSPAESSSGSRLVFPAAETLAAAGSDGMPNRIVALVEAGTGTAVASSVVGRLNETWSEWTRQVFGTEVEQDPGLPSVQWVCVPAGAGGYADRWRIAQNALAARKRVRDFALVDFPRRGLCTLSPRWPLAKNPPGGLRPHEEADLSTANWVKRRWRYTTVGRRDPFPSASAIASAPYRAAVLAILGRDGEDSSGDLAKQVAILAEMAESIDSIPKESPVPGLPKSETRAGAWLREKGGRWVYPEYWSPDPLARAHDFRKKTGDWNPERLTEEKFRENVAKGRAAATTLIQLMRGRDHAPPSTHLAVLTQDLDSMGRFLSGNWDSRSGHKLTVTLDEHERISRLIGNSAKEQRKAIESCDAMGVVVYAGGDDLLALLPAATALDTAQTCHDTVSGDLPNASTSVLFFHHRSFLDKALARATENLEEAKNSSSGKNALAVGYVRRSGVRECCVQPWESPLGFDTGSPVADLALFSPSSETGAPTLSPRLLADLERAEIPLRATGVSEAVYEAEFTRLVARHTIAADQKKAAEFAHTAARALLRMGARSARTPGQRTLPLSAIRVAIFLRQEQS